MTQDQDTDSFYEIDLPEGESLAPIEKTPGPPKFPGPPQPPLLPPASPPRPTVPSRLWVFAPVLLFAAGVLSVTLTQRGIGYAWDEAFYDEPSRDAATWLIEAVKGNAVFSREIVDRAWEERHEHPSFHKIVTGLSLGTRSNTPLTVSVM